MVLFSGVQAGTVSYTLYVNSGIYTAVDSQQFVFAAFNDTPVFSPENKRMIAGPGDSLVVKVINNDTVLHGFKIQDHSAGDTIAPGDSIEISVLLGTGPAAYIYYDHLHYPSYRALGLAGMVCIGPGGAGSFYWELKECQSDWAVLHAEALPVDWATYYPDYFLVNGRSYPHINDDPAARVSGAVGDTLRIVIANTGQSVHSLHFHGYHARILFSSARPGHVGRIKDTFPVQSMQALVIEIVPDKVGEYPVHDHNLVAVSAGGMYPNGMMMTMLIQ